MSAHSHPPISLWRMAVYAAALVVLATARLPDPTAQEVLVAPTAVQLRRADTGSGNPVIHLPSRRASEAPSHRADAVRLLLATLVVAGVAMDARSRRLPWH